MSEAVLHIMPGKKWFEIEAPYAAKFLEAFKEEIPSANRIWDPVDKRWKVNKASIDTCRELLKDYYEYVSESMT